MADATTTLAQADAGRPIEFLGDFVGAIFGQKKTMPRLPEGDNVSAREGKKMPPNGDEIAAPDPAVNNPLATPTSKARSGPLAPGALASMSPTVRLALGVGLAVGVVYLIRRVL
jgi:hypothetical protein